MLITILLSLMMMAGLFLMLLAGVGFIQDKKFFSSAPKEVRDAVPETKPERFKGQHLIGWVMIILSFVLMGSAVVLAAWNGITNNYSFWQFFIRFFLMLILLKVFDIIFFDWVLLSNAGFNFFPNFYPETKTVLGRYLFGYNWKTHLLHTVIFIPSVTLLSWICTLI